MVDTEDGEYAIWDEQTGTYYVDHEGLRNTSTMSGLPMTTWRKSVRLWQAMEALQPEESAESIVEPVEETPVWNYQVGDTVYLDDTAFVVEQITDREVQLRDPSLLYPIFRAENRFRFEEMLSQDERNHAVRTGGEAEEKPVTEEIQNEISPETVQQLEHFIDHFYVAGGHPEAWCAGHQGIQFP